MKEETSYLRMHYFRDEYSADAFPQKLCNFVAEKYFAVNGSKSLKLLDIGSGKGNHLIGFQRCGMVAYGLDKRDECVDILKSFDIRKCDIEIGPFPFESDFFDCVFAKSIIEHVMNTDNLLGETLRVMKKGARLVIMTPAWETQFLHFWDDYTHVKPWTRRGLQNTLALHGYKKVSVTEFYQLPMVWKTKMIMPLIYFLRALPDRWKWKDREESQFREWIRFSKETMLLGYAEK